MGVCVCGFHACCVSLLQDLRKNEPERVRGVGDSVMKELSTFYEEGRMNRLEGLEADPRVRSLELFQKISWVGPIKARELFDYGLRSIEDVRERGQHILTEQGRICLSRCVCVGCVHSHSLVSTHTRVPRRRPC